MDWLFKEDNYVIKEDKDNFIDKTILSILNVLSSIKRTNTNNDKGFIYNINPLVKFISVLILIMLITLSRSIYFIIGINCFNIMLFIMLNKEDKKKFISIGLLVPLFTLIMLIPSMILGNVRNSIIIILKVTANISIINILSFTTKWHSLVKVLKIMFIPNIFIFVFDITIRYMYLLGELSIEMLYALKKKSIGKNNKKYMSISKIMGNLFLKSKEMGEEMYCAMECRGFSGEYPSSMELKITYKECMCIIAIAIIVIIYINSVWGII